MALKANEETNKVAVGQFLDEAGAGIPRADLDLVLLWIYLKGDDTQRLRSSDNILLDAAFTIDEQGNLEWSLTPYETSILKEPVALGKDEKHTLVLRWVWESERVVALVNPFETTAASNIVTIHHAAHAMQVNDSVVFETQSDVGGLDMAIVATVVAVTGPDSYTIKHRKNAISAATGGGNVTAYINGKTEVMKDEMTITRLDPD